MGKRLTGATQRWIGGKPTRLASAKPVLYDIALADHVFRFDSICMLIRYKYGKQFSVYQVRVFIVLAHLLTLLDEISISYATIAKSGTLRCMFVQDIIRSLTILHELDLIEPLGRTKGNLHYKYRLSHDGDALMAWIQSEMEAPVDVLTLNSKTFATSHPTTHTA